MKSWFSGAKIFAILIFVFVALIQIERGICYTRHSEMPGPSVLVQYLVLFCLIAYWLDKDSHEKQVGRVWDMGFFLSVAWPVIIPYHLIKTRGMKRASLIFLFFAITFLAFFGIGAALCRAMQ